MVNSYVRWLCKTHEIFLKSKSKSHYTQTLIWYNEPQYSELNPYPIWRIYWSYYIWYSELFDIVNKKSLTNLFIRSRFEYTIMIFYATNGLIALGLKSFTGARSLDCCCCWLGSIFREDFSPRKTKKLIRTPEKKLK